MMIHITEWNEDFVTRKPSSRPLASRPSSRIEMKGWLVQHDFPAFLDRNWDNFATESVPSPYLTYCAIPPTSFGGKASHLRRRLVASLRSSPSWGFPEFSLAVKQKPGDLCLAPGIISLSPLYLGDWRDTRGKRSLAKNPDRSWWHRHTNLKLFLATTHGSMDNRLQNCILMILFNFKYFCKFISISLWFSANALLTYVNLDTCSVIFQTIMIYTSCNLFAQLLHQITEENDMKSEIRLERAKRDLFLWQLYDEMVMMRKLKL